ncbi:MAG TPA: GNAT family N-acetyltransferase [Gaiellaceae bacterium]|nr:GNAT family N-acetyltransferase [Gaiellaceae bacterium]
MPEEAIVAPVAVRRATAEDADAIAAVHVRTWQGAYRDVFPPDELDTLAVEPRALAWRSHLAGGRVTAFVDDALTGFASVGPSRDEDGVGELYAIYVVPERWGTGVARELLAAAEAELRTCGFAEATLWVLEANPRARGFYESCGWALDGTVKTDVHLGVDVAEVRYRKLL